MSGHGNAEQSLAFSADGRLALTGAGMHYAQTKWTKGDDLTVRVWDVGTGRELYRRAGHSDAVFCARFSPDGRGAASASWRGTVRLWSWPEKVGDAAP